MQKSGFVISVLFLLASCQTPPHRERIIRTDTVYGLTAKSQSGPDSYFDKAIIAIVETRGLPRDSSATQIEWRTDTLVVQGYGPVYDTATKKYRSDSAWQPMKSYNPNLVWIRYFPALKHP